MSSPAAEPPVAPEVQVHPTLLPLVKALGEKTELLAIGDEEIASHALDATKYIFDLALSLEPEAEKHITGLLNAIQQPERPKTRSQSGVANEPVHPSLNLPPFKLTPLDSLFVTGMSSEQVWAQLELRTKSITSVLEAIVQADAALEGGESDSEEGDLMDGEDFDMSAIDDEIDSEEDDSDEDGEEEDGEEDGGDDEEDEDADTLDSRINQESVAPIRPGQDELYPELDLDRERPRSSRSNRPAHPILDDSFFSIDEFNRETEAMESLSRSKGRLSADDEEDEEDEDVDLFRLLEDEPVFAEEDEDEISGNPMYKDFFVAPSRPPPRPAKRSRKDATDDGADEDAVSSSKKKLKTDSTPARGVTFNDSVRVKTIAPRKQKKSRFLDDDEDEDEEMEDVDWNMSKFDDVDENGSEVPFSFDMDDEEEEQEEEEEEDDEEDDELEDGEGVETIQRLKNDLFDDEEDDSPRDVSAYSKRQAELAEQIAALEAQNVGQKDWTLMGEATSRSRPKNSLLEEDLDFERVARAVPVVTEESTKTLEDRIKARILEARYDDVVRKRPADDKAFLPSRVFEISDAKSARSLAQIYEDEYAGAVQGGVAAVDDRDGKLAKEHEEIDKMWGEICYKLDALSNAHFTPKQPNATISTISNLSTTTLESALPTTMSASTLLAPEEVHAPSQSDLIARSEMTPSEKKSARTKARKVRKKRSDALAGAAVKFGGKRGKQPKNVKEAKDAALKSLVKTGKGVTVVGKERQRALGSRGGPGGKGKGEKVADGTVWKL